MKAAILSAGPSLDDLWQKEMGCFYDLVIAVNLACLADVGMYHWAVVADSGPLKRWAKNVRPSVGLLSMPEGIRKYKRGAFDLQPGLSTYTWQDLPWKRQPGCRGISWSSVSAILLAELLGCTEADCYGMDLCGDNHCSTNVAQYSADFGGRWERECKTLQSLRAQTMKRGFTFRRVCYDGTRMDETPNEKGGE